ncbi:reverse transcriptase domain-containing protein [Aquiflexum sp. LQ15W]|uniref:reverse transcriptase domain-containing protein n=1 Tax=Cognataquiflexum nitidum TaxID=2922272 RepID=UPI001F131661|nr:reverse transcriptase domain-containing protein [Cognataquiflexum nitidum]MCH6201318.1 reverse transcriptase domain-containing protein [Cognataquiflexum nitidum]
MKEFETYFSNDEIVKYLCKLRAKVANTRNKKHLIHLLTDSERYNYHVKDSEKYFFGSEENVCSFIKYEKEFLIQLNKILPPRKKWVNLGRKSRIDRITNQAITSSKRNEYSLNKTIKSYRIKSPNEPWLLALDQFINDIQISVKSGTYEIPTPTIFPKLKNDKQILGDNECRPISLFNLKDRIILSITNKYLTRLFDRYFEDCSYAFRSKKNKEGTSVLNHHDCIKEILKYKHQNSNKALWVAECDMEKFYDTVNHKVAKVLFDELIVKCKKDFQTLDFVKVSHIFNQFLECYSFNTNVPPPEDLKYWEGYSIPNGFFKWVASEFKQLGYYEDIESERIGIPQGGALSGLIANIMLNVADKVVLQSGAFYMRFCDDMIIMHADKTTCEVGKELYVNTLKGLKLVPHRFKNGAELVEKRKDKSKERKKLGENSYEPFWKGKSKGPFKWDSLNENGFPWIGFVGYEINYEGKVRVRKKSFLKEIKKQNEVIEEVLKAVKLGMRKSKGSVTESAIHRLVGMSVGRVSLKNFETVSNDLCWKNGFKELKPNKYSIQQIKQLDRNRNRIYYDLLKELKEPELEEENKIESKPRQVIHFNKPFSYYYQVLERRKDIESYQEPILKEFQNDSHLDEESLNA